MKLCYQYMTTFLHLSFPSSHLYPLQVGNCDSNSQLVVDEDDNGKIRPERVNTKGSLKKTRQSLCVMGGYQHK